MDIFEELDSEKNYYYLTKNRSTNRMYHKNKISIDDIDYYSKKVRINSPRSLLAMKKLGITNEELEYLSFKEYLQKYPELIAKNKELQQIKYNYIEEIRLKNIEQIKQLRSEIPEEEIAPIKKRAFSSKLRGQNNYLSYEEHSTKNHPSNQFLDKDIKSFNRMRNINKTELFNRMQIELKKELMKIINEEKERKENEYNRKQQRILNQRMKKENLKKLKEEEQQHLREKEIAKLERRKEEERIQNLILKSNEDEKLLKLKLKQERQRRDEEEKKQNEFREKMDMEREANYQMLLRKSQMMEKKAQLYREELENEKKEMRRNQQEKLLSKRINVEKNLKKMEYEQELKRIMYEQNEKNKNEKKLKEKERYEREMKRNRNGENEKDDKMNKVKERNEILMQKKIFDYNEKQKNMEQKQKKLNYLHQIKNHEKQEAIGIKEQKQKEALFKNELLLNQRKEEIMNKIIEKERSIKKTREMKKRQNLLAQGEQFQKKLDKEYRVKQIAILLENRRNEIREQLNEKDKRVEEFMLNKSNKAHQKRIMYDEITKEKQLDNEQFEKMLSKKNVDKNVLNSIKEMFPNNRQVDGIINEFNEYLE